MAQHAFVCHDFFSVRSIALSEPLPSCPTREQSTWRSPAFQLYAQSRSSSFLIYVSVGSAIGTGGAEAGMANPPVVIRCGQSAIKRGNVGGALDLILGGNADVDGDGGGHGVILTGCG